ncbi:MAG: biotin carboxylase [Leucobacter sp.]
MVSLDETADALLTNNHGVFFVSRTGTHLGGVDRWIGGFSYILYRDSWDGTHPRVFVPQRKPLSPVRGAIRAVNWLLKNNEVQHHIDAHTPAGQRPKIIAAFFDRTTESICEQLGYELIMPKDTLRTRVDSKIVTTQLGNVAGVPSVPNILTRATSWEDLSSQAAAAGLGEHLVVQTPYGNSGQTTYFMSSSADFDRVAAEVSDADLKIMRRIEHRPLTVDAVITRDGTVVGPLLSEITGHAELTKYEGGWSGNELSDDLLPEHIRTRGAEMVHAFAESLSLEGYRGVFCVDLLLDTEQDELFLGELNPRLSGASPASNIAVSQATGMPLIAFHLLEFSGNDSPIPIDEANSLIREQTNASGDWSHVLVQYLDHSTARVLQAPLTGRYRRSADGSLSFISRDLDWFSLESGAEVFFLRLTNTGDICETSQDLGLLVTRSRIEDDSRELTDDAVQLIGAIQKLFHTRELTPFGRAIHFAQRAFDSVSARLRNLLTR